MKTNRVFAASLLAANFRCFSEAVESVNNTAADWLHLDIMDGNFVPEITFGAQLVSQIRTLSTKPFDVHLMVENPGRHIRRFADSGADLITVHYEQNPELLKQLSLIRELGKKAGVAVKPETAPENLPAEVLSAADLILIMTVEPGYGGQKLMKDCLEKVDYLSQIREKRGYTYYISIDGGVNRDTFGIIRDKDVDVLVAGSAFFGSEDREAEVRFFKS